MELDWNILRREEQTMYRLRGLYERYGYRRFKMSKFEEYDSTSATRTSWSATG